MGGLEADFADGVFEKDTMWFFDNSVQAVCKMDISTGKINAAAVYRGEEMFHVRWIFLYHDKFYMVQFRSHIILVYDRNRAENDSFYIVKPYSEYTSDQFNVFFDQDSIWFVPHYTDETLYRLDLRTEEYKKQILFKEISLKCFGRKRCPIIFSSFYKDVLCIAIPEKERYVKYDFTSGTYAEGEMKNKDALLEGAWICDMQRYIAVLPRFSPNIILIDKNDNESNMVNLPLHGKELKRSDGHSNFINCHCHLDYIFVFPHGIRGFFKINKKTFEVERLKLDFAEATELRQYTFHKFFKYNGSLCKEMHELNLTHFLDYIMLASDVDGAAGNNSGYHVGEKIWNAVKR